MTFKLAQIIHASTLTESRSNTIGRSNIFETARTPEEWVPLVVANDVAVLRLSGHCRLDQAVRSAETTILAAKSHRISKVLVIATDIAGFDPPSISARHAMVRELAFAAGGAVCLAAVLRRNMIDPHKFDVIAAKNFGLTMDVFASEREALTWLRCAHR